MEGSCLMPSTRLEKNIVWCGKVRIGYVCPSADGYIWSFIMRSETLDAAPWGRSSTQALAYSRVVRAMEGWCRAAGIERLEFTLEDTEPPPVKRESPRARAKRLL